MQCLNNQQEATGIVLQFAGFIYSWYMHLSFQISFDHKGSVESLCLTIYLHNMQVRSLVHRRNVHCKMIAHGKR